MSRTYKINGQDTYGTELSRSGDMVTLQIITTHWPFPQTRILHRSVITWMHGDREPSGDPEREGLEPVQFENRTDSLFEDGEAGGPIA